MSRLKTTHTGLRSESEFRATCDKIATLQLRTNILSAKRDRRIQQIRDEADPEISAAEAERDALLTLAEAYAEAHREELFPGERKSAESALCVYGFRLGNPTLKPLNGRWTWARILEHIKQLGLLHLVVTKEALDKDRIKADVQSDAELSRLGMRIEQVDAFYIDPMEAAAARDDA